MAFAAAVPALAGAVPFTPTNADQVVEELPTRWTSAADRAAERTQRAELQRHPDRLTLALQLARQAVERARRAGDPRELGEAQAVLAPWWPLAEAPAPVRLLRAIVLQSRHEFAPALRDLDALIADPAGVPIDIRAQAELTRASVLQVQGRWAEAAAGCERLAGPAFAALGSAVGVPARVCLADLQSLTGQAEAADRAVTALVREAGGRFDPGWLALVRAEMAERRGDPAAGRYYGIAVQQGGDIYTLGAYADWLLARGEARQAAALLAGREAVDPLLLRLAIAYRRSSDPRSAGAIAALKARFDAAAARGDASHGREQARFALDLLDDPPAALAHAEANWKVQKEPADALILARAARAAKRPDAAASLARFVKETGWTDVRLAGLLERSDS